jgi:hypothetical protein
MSAAGTEQAPAAPGSLVRVRGSGFFVLKSGAKLPLGKGWRGNAVLVNRVISVV